MSGLFSFRWRKSASGLDSAGGHRVHNAWHSPAGRSLLSALAVFAILLVVWWRATHWYEAQLLSEYKAQAALRASLRGNALSLAIDRRFALLQGLHAYVQAEGDAPDFEHSFRAFAAGLYKTASARGVRSIAVAPDGIVRYVYPIEGNEQVIGYVPLDDPRVRQDVERAIASRQIILSGPDELAQGGVGLIARQAVYMPSEDGQGEIFWGLVSIVLDLPSLFDEAELDVQTDITLEYALRGSDGGVFYGAQAVFDQDPVIHLISLPGGVWELAGVSDGGWQTAVRRPLRISQIAGLIIILLLTGLTYLSIRRQTELAQAFARQKAITEENIRLHERSRGLAILEERQRLARELHDSVSQALYGIGLGARTARTLLDRDPSKAAEPMDYVLSLAEAGLTEMRALIFELRPDSLEREGLVSALGKQVAALRARHGLEVEAVFDEEPDLPFEAKEAFYRIAQEALNNVVKHARSARVKIRLEDQGGTILLSIQDDGIGFDPRNEYPDRMGLHSMRERAERLGGSFEIHSEPGAGTRLQVIVPAVAPS